MQEDALAQSKGTADTRRAPEGFFCSVLFFFFYQLITFKQILTLELVGKCQLLFLSSGLAQAELAWHFH